MPAPRSRGADAQGGAVPATDVVVGRVQRVIWRGGEDGFSVVQILRTDPSAAERGDQRAVLVGHLAGVHEGDGVRAVGRWQEHPRFGTQFRAESYQKVLPDTERGVQAYLSKIPHVGPVLAQRLIAAFGADTLEVLAQAPERVREVPGIGAKRAEAVLAALEQDVVAREALIFLQGLGIPPGLAHRIMNRYEADAVARVREDPFRLADEIGGVGFRTADAIARALGVAADHPSRVRAAVIFALRQAQDSGHLYLPARALAEEAAALIDVAPHHAEAAVAALLEEGRFCLAGSSDDLVGPSEHLETERYIAAVLARMIGRRPAPAPEEVELDAAERQLGVQLDTEQRRAVAIAVREALAVVTGGPGTGKTTILRGTLSLLLQRGRTVALAAPTGRAARRLTEATGAEAKTLHRLLEYSPRDERFMRDEDNPIAEDVVIVDEASMIDTALMGALCAAVRADAQLLLVGDADQLPSVGPGLVLHDILSSERVPVVRLETVYRQARNSGIVGNAHRVLAGERPVAPDQEGPLADFYLLELESPEAIRAAVEAMVVRRIPSRFGLDPKQDIQVLVPMRRGILGAEALNRRLQELLNPSGRPIGGRGGLRAGDRVIQNRNDYDLDVVNGDVGVVVGPGAASGEVVVRFDGRDVCYSEDAAEALRLAYALSIHKSQGSEYPAVILPLHTQHYVMLRRNLLYTAITRGRQLVVLVGSRRAIATAVRRDDAVQRHTRLRALLRGASVSP